ncbi:MAG: carbohydrate ABC transporter permease [Aestuariivirga sp.]|uniref:carbohydrate ABC transporter permease n=1 Tax=Aestuariivirga sp. TaxID=2650926 RepID=UPI0038CFC7CD
MYRSQASVILRDILAVLVVGAFMFPLFWWGLTSIKPDYAIFDKDGINWFSFEPTLENYRVTVLGQSRLATAEDQGIAVGSAGAGSYDSRQSLFDSIIIALGATLVSVGVAVFAAYGLSRMAFRGRGSYLNWVLGQRFMPPVAIVVPLVLIYRDFGMRDVNNIFLGYLGLVLIYALMNLPIALLLMKSFFDDVPKDVDEAAMIDGATRWQVFWKVVLPMVKGGVAACAVLCFVFSWTEFLISLMLTTDIRTVPVKISTFVTSTGNEWGYISALGMAGVIPGFIFILLVQRHLVRGLTLGSLKE